MAGGRKVGRDFAEAGASRRMDALATPLAFGSAERPPPAGPMEMAKLQGP